MKIYFIRHGSTLPGENHLYCGSSDVPLSENGRKSLSKSDFTPDIIISSPLKRCVETAQIMFPEKNIKISSELREMDFGRFELHSYEELKTDTDYIDWITDETGDYICPGGESKNIFFDRVSKAFERELDSLCSDTAFILHGGVIGAIMELYCNVKKPYYEWKPPYGGGFETEYSNDYVLSFLRYL